MIGAGVVCCAVALALARRGVEVVLLEAEADPARGASGTNSGILHTGFDRTPGELEKDLILASSALRDPVLRALGISVLPCGALMRPADDSQRGAVEAVATRARRTGVQVLMQDGALELPGEAVTDPVAYPLALAADAERQGAELRTRFRAVAIERDPARMTVRAEDGTAISCHILVNSAGMQADSARFADDDSFEKGEFLVFDPPEGKRLERIVLPVPSKHTRGVLVLPTLDAKIVAGPTAVDREDKNDWSVRHEARDEIIAKARLMYPPLEHATPIATYAGLRPAGRGVNYVIGPSRACRGLVNVAASRSTGLTASLGIGHRLAGIIGSLEVTLGPERELLGGPPPKFDLPRWRRTANYPAVTA